MIKSNKAKTKEKPTDHLWKDVVGYEGLYEVNEIGNVWSVRRKHLMSAVPDKNGYLRMSLWRDRKLKRTSCAQLVADAFLVKPISEKKLVICHGDGSVDNNHWQNLYWGTYRQNSDDRIKHGTYDPGKRGGLSNLTIADALEIRRLFAEDGMMQKDIAKMFNVTSVTIHHIVRRHTWTHI